MKRDADRQEYNDTHQCLAGVSSSEETGDYDFEQLQSLADRRLYSQNRPGVIGYSRAITLNGRRKMVQPFTPAFRSFTLRSPDAGRILIMQMDPSRFSPFTITA